MSWDVTVTCPKCKKVVPNVAVVRQRIINNVGYADVGFKCPECKHEWGFDLE